MTYEVKIDSHLFTFYSFSPHDIKMPLKKIRSEALVNINLVHIEWPK